MSNAVPRPVLFVGAPILAGLVGVAVWAWMRFGFAVWFDTIATGISLCL